MTFEIRWCSPCTQDQPFESPPCQDGHGDQCLDLACLVCGHAVIVGVLVQSVGSEFALVAA